MPRTTLQFWWQNSELPEQAQTGVSLHSHTSLSEEGMDLILSHVNWFWPLQKTAGWVEDKYSRMRPGAAFDWRRAFWTPPPDAERAIAIEQAQIEGLGLHPIVSISDHDNCDAGLALQGRRGFSDTPISTEWTLPFGRTILHLGVHNLPRNQARALMIEMSDYTGAPDSGRLRDLLVYLDSFPETLIVVNHPLYDEAGLGAASHGVLLGEFLTRFRPLVHALELNGLRPWTENEAVMRLAADVGLPYVSGGDRHGSEANANLNLTEARTFPEFGHELRFRKRSHVVFLPQYKVNLKARRARTVVEVAERWSERLFYREPCGKVERLRDVLRSNGDRTGNVGKRFRTAALR